MIDALSIAFTAVGHASFALTFLSYAQRDIIRLRMIAVASLCCGLAYNGWVQSKMSGDDTIWLVIFWLTIFLIQNIFLLVREIRAGLEVPLPADSRSLLVKTFPSMHSRDWAMLMKLARLEKFTTGTTVISVGASTSSLRLIASGVATEDREGLERSCGAGTLWGELTYVLGEDQFNASPMKITAATDLCIYSWTYEDLRKIAKGSLRFSAALHHGFISSAGLKHGLLWTAAQAQREAAAKPS